MNIKDQCETLIVCFGAAVFVALTIFFFPLHRMFLLIFAGTSLICIFGAGLDVLHTVGLKLTDDVQNLKRLRITLVVLLIALIATGIF